MNAEQNFSSELDHAIASASASRRSEMVNKVTDLFVSKSDECTVEDLSIFDEVIIRFSGEIEQQARALLAKRLAPIRNAPPRIIRLLAFDDAIDVAGPILSQSARLDDKTLIEVARTKGQAHMLAISQRGSLSELVTDVLVDLGDREVLLNALDNFGANFSDRGFAALVRRSGEDEVLAEFIGSRPEIPSPLLTELVAKASEAVRSKLEAAHPRARAAVRQAVAEATARMEAQVRSIGLDYTAAVAAVDGLQRSGQLNEATLAAYAKAGAYAETVVALARLCDLPLPLVEQAMARDRSETLMVIAKAVELSWSTAQELLMLRAKKGIISQSEIVQRLARFERLRSGTAREIVQVLRTRTHAAETPGK